MSIASTCPACMAGNHEGHDRAFGLKPGLIGGEYCACSGDCPPPMPPEMQALIDGWTPRVDPQPQSTYADLIEAGWKTPDDMRAAYDQGFRDGQTFAAEVPGTADGGTR